MRDDEAKSEAGNLAPIISRIRLSARAHIRAICAALNASRSFRGPLFIPNSHSVLYEIGARECSRVPAFVGPFTEATFLPKKIDECD